MFALMKPFDVRGFFNQAAPVFWFCTDDRANAPLTDHAR